MQIIINDTVPMQCKCYLWNLTRYQKKLAPLRLTFNTINWEEFAQLCIFNYRDTQDCAVGTTSLTELATGRSWVFNALEKELQIIRVKRVADYQS